MHLSVAMTHEIPVTFETNLGALHVLLDPVRAPETVDNFLDYVDKKHYDGTVLHRIIRHYIVQGGGYDAEYKKLPVGEPIANEADNGLSNLRGTLSMAHLTDPASATAQWFFNVEDNPFLDHRGSAPYDFGYAVFGHLVLGMDVLDRIRDLPTGPHAPFKKDVPLEPLIVQAIRRG